MKTFTDIKKEFNARGYSELSAPYWTHRAFEYKQFGEQIFKHQNINSKETQKDIREIAALID